MALLSRTDLLDLVPKSLADLPFTEVEVRPGKIVRVRALGSDEKDAFEVENARLREEKGDSGAIGFRARAVVWSCCNEIGSRLMEYSDAEAMGKADAAMMDLLFNAADELNGFTGRRREELKKNLGTTSSADSS